MNPLLEVRDLAVKFDVKKRILGGGGELTAVDGVSLLVERGQTLGVLW